MTNYDAMATVVSDEDVMMTNIYLTMYLGEGDG